MWQTVERKAAFIAQVSSGRAVEREVEDIGEQALSFAEVKALATGNPLILEKAAVDAEVARLARMRRSHQDDQHRLRVKLATAEGRAARLERQIAELETALARRVDTRGDRFEMTVEGVRHRSRAEAGDHLRRVIASALTGRQGESNTPFGSLGGFSLRLVHDAASGEVVLAFEGIDDDVRGVPEDILAVESPTLVRRLERRLQAIDGLLVEAAAERRAACGEAERAHARLGAAFPFDDALREAGRRQREINESLLTAGEHSRAEPSHAERMASRLEGVPVTRSSMRRS